MTLGRGEEERPEKGFFWQEGGKGTHKEGKRGGKSRNLLPTNVTGAEFAESKIDPTFEKSFFTYGTYILY